MERFFIPVSLFVAVTLSTGCARQESNATAKGKQPKSPSSQEVVSVSAAIQSDDASAKAVAEEFAAADSEPQYSAPKGPGQTPAQSPGQSPGQSPMQSPMQMSVSPADDLTGITVKKLSYSGAGCPENSVATNISPDAKAFTLLFDSFFVETAPEQQIMKARKSCTIAVELVAPAGWQVALMSVDFRGFADLGHQDLAVLTGKYRFTGSDSSDSFTALIQGARSDDFQARSEAFLKTFNWSGCESNKTLNIEIATEVQGGSENPASLTLDSVDGEVSYRAGLMWKKCS